MLFNNKERIDHLLKMIEDKLVLKDGFFVVYGSYAIGEETENSDLDVIYILYERPLEQKESPERRSLLVDGISISLYIISEELFNEDSKGRYGGFFVQKCLNPHLIIPRTSLNNAILDNAAGNFLALLLKLTGESVFGSTECLVCSILNQVIDLCPDYLAYLVRYYQSSQAPAIQKWMHEFYFSSLQNVGAVKKKDSKIWRDDVTLCEDKLKIRLIANFWGCAALLHERGDFYDYYHAKNDTYLSGEKEKYAKIVGETIRRPAMKSQGDSG